jgi:hypothetical protein
MVGALPLNARVYVDIVPPAGNFITGIAAVSENPTFLAWANLSAPSAAGTTTSAAYVDAPGSPTITLNKTYVQTYIRLDLGTSLFSTLAGTVVRYGILFNGTTDSDLSIFGISVANTHVAIAATTVIFAWAFKGPVTMRLRWKRVSGGGTLTMDSNDMVSLTAVEMPPP